MKFFLFYTILFSAVPSILTTFLNRLEISQSCLVNA